MFRISSRFGDKFFKQNHISQIMRTFLRYTSGSILPIKYWKKTENLKKIIIEF